MAVILSVHRPPCSTFQHQGTVSCCTWTSLLLGTAVRLIPQDSRLSLGLLMCTFHLVDNIYVGSTLVLELLLDIPQGLERYLLMLLPFVS
jgi:hypothetical protein